MNHGEWLRGEVAAWRTEGLVGDDVAAAILRRYEAAPGRLSWAALIAGGFGSLLIGLGVISLFAANWDVFGRGARAAISMAPVALCGLAAVFATRKGWTAPAFWEPLGILWCIATGAAACLVAQTYQVGGTVPGLVLFVALLTLPVVWVTKAVAPMALWPVFAIAWTIASEDVDGESWTLLAKALALMALSLPAYLAFLRRKPPRAALVVGQLVTGFVYSLGTAILIATALPRMEHGFNDRLVFGVCWTCAALVGLVGVKFKLPVWPMVATLVASGMSFVTVFGDEYIDFYFASLVLAGVTIAYGIRTLRLAYTNIGAALFMWLVLGKFFESDLSFTLKGIVFILAGVALTVMNVTLARMKRGRAGK